MITAAESRQAALALPEAEERETWGHPTFRVRDKMFASLSEDGQMGGIKTTRHEQLALIAAAPETFGAPAYVGRHGWVSVRLGSADPGEVRELLVEGWRRTAPNAWSPPTTPGSSARVGPGRRRVSGGGVACAAWLLDPGRFR